MFKPKNRDKRNKNSNGYFGIGIENLNHAENLGTLWRSAVNFGASFIFTIGKKYRLQSSDTTRSHRHIPLHQYGDFEEFWSAMPRNCRVVGVEIDDRAKNIVDHQHFERTIYLLGSETNGLSETAIEHCHDLIYLPSKGCLNVSVSGSIVMYDRLIKE
jgi:tRNA (guanosine-2'-O-)-methyltransferase